VFTDRYILNCVYWSVHTEFFNVVYFNFGAYQFFFFYPCLPNTKFSQNACLLSSTACSNSLLSITLHFSIPNVLPCYQPFPEGRAGRAWETAEESSFLTAPHPSNRYNVCSVSLSASFPPSSVSSHFKLLMSLWLFSFAWFIPTEKW